MEICHFNEFDWRKRATHLRLRHGKVRFVSMKHSNLDNWVGIGVRVLAACAVAALLSSCAEGGLNLPQPDLFDTKSAAKEAVEFTPEERLMAQTPPQFQVGDCFHFDNPDVTWRVVAVREDEVDWVADSGETQTTGHNPLMPALAWSSANRGSGRRLISDIGGDLFPLRVGRRMTFKSTVSTDKPPYAWEFEWVCEILAEQKVVSSAGTFNTFQIPCGRQRPDEVTFFYAPGVGNYVRLDAANTKGSGVIRRDLLAFERVSYLQDGTRIISSGGEAHQPGFNESDPNEAPPPAEPYDGVQPLPVQVTDAMADIKSGGKAGKHSGPTSLTAQSAAGGTSQQTASASAQSKNSATKAAVPGGEFLAHLASYKKPANATAGWTNLKSRFATLLDGYKPFVKRVDLGSKGIYHRLYAGPLQSRDMATKLCAALKQRGAYCKPAKP